MKSSTIVVSKQNLIERINPLTKILAVFSFGLGTLIFPKLWLGFVIIIGLFIIAYLANLLKAFAKMIVGFGIPVALMLLFIQGFYNTKNETFIADFGFAQLGLEGVLYALKIVTTLLVFLGSFYLMKQTTETGKMVAALTDSGVSPKAGYLILATLNVVPQMQRRMVIIQETQEARGVEIAGNLFSRVKAYLPLLGPVIMSSLTDAQERGMTLETRGFGIKGVKQTSYIKITTTQLDKVINSCLLLFFFLILVLTILMKMAIL